MTLKKHIPNFITLLNLLCGGIAVLFAVNSDFMEAAFFVSLGIFFDFFDGLLARKLGVQSPLGIQLDSLADMVTSGLTPGIVMYKLLTYSLDAGEDVYTMEWNDTATSTDLVFWTVPIIGLFITLASAYRLAKFNIDEDQQSSFKGLPTPANALLIISLPLILEFQNIPFANSLILNTWFLIGFTLLSCNLLNSSIRLFALKFKTYALTGNYYRYGLVILSIFFLITLKFAAIPLIIFSYFILSFMHYKTVEE